MSNNALQNRNCPALMSDQRFATDHRNSADVHQLIIKQNGIKNSEEMRLFLQRNASQLRALDQAHFKGTAGCESCTYYHVDPNGHDKHWKEYRKNLKSQFKL